MTEKFDPELVKALVNDIFDCVHVAAPEEMDDDTIHVLGTAVCLAAAAKFGEGMIPLSMN